MNKQKLIYYCKEKECNNIIHWHTALYKEGRCKSCARKYQYAIKPETNPRFIDGRTNIKKYCKNCGKELSRSANCNNYERCLSCSRIGELHWNWLDGNTKNGYTSEFSNKLKELIRERDNNKCQICHKTTEEHLQQFEVDLCIHHIDYNKQNYNKKNLISLCISCHVKTNYNRDYWKVYFESKKQEALICQN